MGDTSVNYWEVEIPEEEDPSGYGYQARRADILRHFLIDKRHPDEVNWSELARYYEKSKSTIHNDKVTLLEYITEEFDAERVRSLGVSMFEGAIREVLTDDDYDAFDEHALYAKWLDTLDTLGLIDLDEGDDAEDLFLSDDEGGISVEIAGVAAADVDMSDLPEQDRPGADEGEGTEADAEVVET